MTPSPNPAPEPAPEKSATPRTDDAAHRYFDSRRYNRKAPAVYAKDMAALETDLAQARAELAEAKKNLGFHKGLADAVSALNVQADDTIKALREALEDAIKYQVSNLGYPHQEFYRCITKPFGEMPEWVVTAKQALASTQEDAP